MNRSRENGSSVYQRSCIFLHAKKLCSLQRSGPSLQSNKRWKTKEVKHRGSWLGHLSLLLVHLSQDCTLPAPCPQPRGQSGAAVNASQKVEAKVECHTPRGQRAACSVVEACECRGYEAMLNWDPSLKIKKIRGMDDRVYSMCCTDNRNDNECRV